MTFPTIETKRLRLVAPSLDYAADVFAYASDPEFCRYIGAKPCRSIEGVRRLGFSAKAPRKGYYKTESGPVDCAVLALLRE